MDYQSNSFHWVLCTRIYSQSQTVRQNGFAIFLGIASTSEVHVQLAYAHMYYDGNYMQELASCC